MSGPLLKLLVESSGMNKVLAEVVFTVYFIMSEDNFFKLFSNKCVSKQVGM